MKRQHPRAHYPCEPEETHTVLLLPHRLNAQYTHLQKTPAASFGQGHLECARHAEHS
jgi:hypothetical protein